MNDSAFQQLLDEVVARSNERRRGTVRGLIQILNQMASRGTKVFTVAAVGRECEAANVLKTQTIRNANGEDFRRLIDAFALDKGVSTTHSPARRLSPLDEAIAAIPDLDIRTRLRAMMAESRAQRSEIQALRQGFAHLQTPPQSNTGPAEKALQFDVEILPPRKNNLNLGPLERFASAEWIDDQAWTIGENGAIYAHAALVSPPGFVPALRAAIEFIQDSRGEKGHEHT